MPRSLLAIVMSVLLFHAQAQVSEIKSGSTQTSRSVEGGSGGSGSGFMVEFVAQLLLGNVVTWQQSTLEKRESQRSLISIDGWVQAGGQASSYYLVQPRLRANWGIFSTDFRVNYVIEEDFNSLKHVRTSDWQILQLNIVTARDATFRIGGGIMSEAYEARNTYPEWTAGLHLHPQSGKFSGLAEYRSSDARKEVNGHIRYSVLESRKLHPYILFGATWQRYYSQVTVWGMQLGFGISIF